MGPNAHIPGDSRPRGLHPAGVGRVGGTGRPTLLRARRILARLIVQQSPSQLTLLRRGDAAARHAMVRRALLRASRQSLLAPEYLSGASRRIAARLWADARVRDHLLGIVEGGSSSGLREDEAFDAKRMWRNRIQAGLLKTREVKRRVARGTAAEQGRREARTQLARMAHGMFSRSVRRAVIDDARARRGMPPLSVRAYAALLALATSNFVNTLIPVLEDNTDSNPGVGAASAVATTAVATALQRSGVVHKDDVPWVARMLNLAVTHPQEIQSIVAFIAAFLRSRGLMHEAETEHSMEGWS